MKIQLNNRSVACCRETFDQAKIIQEKAECIVPDVYEDIGEIVSEQAQLCLKSKEIIADGVSVEAIAEIGILYITEDRQKIRCLNLSKTIKADFECTEVESDANAQVSLFCLGIQARAVNTRKITLQIAVLANLSCWTSDDINVPFEEEGGKSEGLQLREESVDCVITKQLQEKSFLINEQIPLDAEALPTEILHAQAELLFIDYQLIGNKALLKGQAELHICCNIQDRALPLILERGIPFSVLIDLPDEGCTLGRVIFETTALYVDLNDAINGSRVIEVELHALSQLRIDKTETVSYLSDAYCTRCPTIMETEDAAVCLSLGAEKLRAEIAERMPVEENRGSVVLSFGEILSFSEKDGKAIASASVSLLFCSDDGSFSAQQRLLSFERDLNDLEEQILGARIVSICASREGAEVTIEASVEFDCARREHAEIRFLSGIELDTENAIDAALLPSLTIARRSGQDNWEIAKLFSSSVEAIEEINKKHELNGDLLLIPRV
jgi:hypothetical protein